jgi:hypothetical protein
MEFNILFLVVAFMDAKGFAPNFGDIGDVWP